VRASRASGRRTRAQLLGGDAEERAARLLSENGLEILARNYRTRMGEIDLVARDGDVLVFVEVRHRSRDDFGDGAESVTERKQRRIEAAARLFLQQFEREPRCRFDVMSLDDDHAEWMKAAFDASPG